MSLESRLDDIEDLQERLGRLLHAVADAVAGIAVSLHADLADLETANQALAAKTAALQAAIAAAKS